MTRLKYDAADRKAREALQKGMDDYKISADGRAAEAKRKRAVSTKNQRSNLRKLADFGRA